MRLFRTKDLVQIMDENFSVWATHDVTELKSGCLFVGLGNSGSLFWDLENWKVSTRTGNYVYLVPIVPEQPELYSDHQGALEQLIGSANVLALVALSQFEMQAFDVTIIGRRNVIVISTKRPVRTENCRTDTHIRRDDNSQQLFPDGIGNLTLGDLAHVAVARQIQINLSIDGSDVYLYCTGV